MRRGRAGMSSACGALIAFNGQLAGGRVDVGTNPTDLEQSFVKQSLMPKLKFGGALPTLAELTSMAEQVTAQTCKQTLEAASAAGDTLSSAAIVSGILIHGPEGSHYFWPGSVRVAQELPVASRRGVPTRGVPTPPTPYSDVLRRGVPTPPSTPYSDVLREVHAASRDDYMGEMLQYVRTKAQGGGMLCQDCGGDVQLHPVAQPPSSLRRDVGVTWESRGPEPPSSLRPPALRPQTS